MAKIDIAPLDRRIKLGLLAASLITIVLLIVAALQENIFPEWRSLRKEYAKILDEKATDERGRKVAAQFEIGIDHYVVPELNAVDRCITCHVGLDDPRMTEVKQPFQTHPGTLLQTHPPERFGCTLCHQGQGRATESEEAHGQDEDWLYPMYAREFMYSTCRKCHDDESLYGEVDLLAKAGGGTASPAALALAEGRQLMETKGCLGCHTLNGRGGTLGPDISVVGDKTRHDFDFSHFERNEPRDVSYWLQRHFLEPSEISPDTSMPDMNLTKESAVALTAYVLSLRASEVPAVYTLPQPAEQVEVVPATGEELYMLMCAACHGPEGRQSDVPGIRTPALNNIDSLAVASDDYYRLIIDRGRSGTAMPPWGPESGNMTYDEIDRVVSHIRTWQPDGARLSRVSSQVGDATMGQAYYQGMCANCHGKTGEGGLGNSLRSPTFLAVVSDRFLADTIVNGRPGTAMASWRQLPEQAVSDLLAYIRTWQSAPSTFADTRSALSRGSADEIDVGRILYRAHCSSCHGISGEGGIGPRLNSQDVVPISDDEYLHHTMVYGRPTTAMPSWRHLQSDQVAAIISYMRSWNGGKIIPIEEAPPRGDYALGEVHYKVACVGCHGPQAEGGVGPQLANPEFLSAASDDLLYHWIARGRAGTAMKGFLNVEQGPVELTRENIGDIIAYIRNLGSRAERPILRTGIGNALLGAQLFRGSCSGCHGPNGEGASGPQLNNTTLLRSASDGFLTATIVLGRAGTPMTSMVHGQQGVSQLDPRNVQDVIAFMRLWDREQGWRLPRAIAEMSERAITSGRDLFSNYCQGCHGTNGRGIQDGPDYFAPALNNPEFLAAASDGFLLATIARGRSRTPMRPFGIGAGGIADLEASEINDIVSFIRTWEEAYTSTGD